MGADKEEWPPLFPPGFYTKTLVELRGHCVMQPRFKASPTRELLMGRLDEAIKRLVAAGIQGEIWVDGSFLTEKFDPEDVDASLRVDGDFFDGATQGQRDLMYGFMDLWDCEKIDGYLHFEWPVGHVHYELGQHNFATWQKQWGVSRRGVLKGIAVVELPRVNP